MDLSTAWARQLHLLTGDLDGYDGAFRDSALGLVLSLQVVVPSFCGLVLTSESLGEPVRFSSFDPSPAAVPRTSLSWRAAYLTSTETDRLVLYASRPGALVDLAADLQHVGRQRRSTTAGPELALDQDFPPRPVSSGFSGLVELAVISRAEGMLLERGTDPADLSAELRRQARAHGLDPYAYASHLLGRAPSAGDSSAG